MFDFRDVIILGAEHSSLRSIADRAASTLGLEITPDPEPEQQYFVRSDHYSFVKRGIPALCPFRSTKAIDPLTDVSKIYADYGRTRYHLPSDDLKQYFDWQSAAKSARLSFLLGNFIAQDPAKPRWNDRDFFARFERR